VVEVPACPARQAADESEEVSTKADA